MIQFFAEAATGELTTTSVTTGTTAGSFLLIYGIFFLLAIPLYIIPLWKIFNKAGKPGWAAIVPIYSTWVLFEITGFPAWWSLLGLVPFVGIFPAVVTIIATFRLAKLFGKGTGFGLGLIFLPFIFYPIIGYGKAQFLGTTPSGPAGMPPVDPNTGTPVAPTVYGDQPGIAPQPLQAPQPPQQVFQPMPPQPYQQPQPPTVPAPQAPNPQDPAAPTQQPPQGPLVQ